MTYPKILTVQDISCVGQCSTTVALPIISACGIETCVLPGAILSTHTAGFTGYTFCDMTDEMPAIAAHWQKEGVCFDAIYSGYLGSSRQVDVLLSLYNTASTDRTVKIVDPAMADGGKLYPGFDADFVANMKRLCAKADYLLPNLTEACLLTDTEYRTDYDKAYIDAILQKLLDLGCKNVIFTGVSYREDKTGIAVCSLTDRSYYEHDFLPGSCHGTGDIYASAFTGALVQGKSAFDAAKIAADYTVACIQETANHPNHWYGAAFEPVLYKLIQMIKN